MSEEKTKITFDKKSETCIHVMRDGKKIGHIYSEDGGSIPYPHNRDEYCLNSIQICGFDKMDGPWGCGDFRGRKDLVCHFRPENNHRSDKLKEYAKYVASFFKVDKQVQETQTKKYVLSSINKRESAKLNELMSFEEWCYQADGLPECHNNFSNKTAEIIDKTKQEK